jgi:hypothetical protein
MVDQTAKQALAARNDYRPKDLLSQGDLRAVVSALAKKGWKVPQGRELVETALPDDDVLVRLFRGSKQGVGFMRSVEKYTLAYDRLDRLIRLPGGEMTIKALIRGPDGYKLVQYYTETASRGNSIVEVLPRGYNGQLPSSKGFNDPTGRIYTEKMLLAELKKRYDAQAAAAQAAAAAGPMVIQ